MGAHRTLKPVATPAPPPPRVCPWSGGAKLNLQSQGTGFESCHPPLAGREICSVILLLVTPVPSFPIGVL